MQVSVVRTPRRHRSTPGNRVFVALTRPGGNRGSSADSEPAGVMMAGGDNGDIEWRAFLDNVSDPDLFGREYEFIISMRDFAVARGELADLPPVLQASSGDPADQ